jgi:hypothetical protein
MRRSLVVRTFKCVASPVSNRQRLVMSSWAILVSSPAWKPAVRQVGTPALRSASCEEAGSKMDVAPGGNESRRVSSRGRGLPRERDLIALGNRMDGNAKSFLSSGERVALHQPR